MMTMAKTMTMMMVMTMMMTRSHKFALSLPTLLFQCGLYALFTIYKPARQFNVQHLLSALKPPLTPPNRSIACGGCAVNQLVNYLGRSTCQGKRSYYRPFYNYHILRFHIYNHETLTLLELKKDIFRWNWPDLVISFDFNGQQSIPMDVFK